MNNIASAVLDSSLMPHGYCLLWFPDLLLLHVASDLLIALSYYTIPIILFYFIRKRRETPFPWLILLFAAFIFSCGTTHLLESLTIWYPIYRLEGYAKLATGLISAVTAISLFPVLPRALALRSPTELAAANQALAIEVDNHRITEGQLAEARDQLEARVAERTASLSAANARLEAEIQERQRAEAALAAEKEQALVTLRCIGDGVIVTDRHGRIELLNPAAASLTGFHGNTALGRPIASVFRVLEEHSREPRHKQLLTCLRGETPALGDDLLLLDREDGEHAVQVQVSPIRHAEADPHGMVVSFSDVSEIRRLAREMAFQAHHDPLTALPNRRELEQRLDRLLTSLGEHNHEHVLCYLDLDRFKLVNDSAGHQAGDRLLRELTGLLQETIRARDTLARGGGDEFCLLLENCPVAQAETLVMELVARVEAHRFQWQGQEFRVGVSIGLTPLVADDNHDRLMARADAACYQAKEAGRGRVHISLPGGAGETIRQLDPTDLRRYLETDAIELDCRSIYALDPEANADRHYTLQTRILTAGGEYLDQETLLTTAGYYHLLHEFNRRLIQVGLGRAERLLGPGDPAWVAIPVAIPVLRDRQLPLFLARCLAAVDLEPAQLCLAIDEPATLQECELVADFIQRLRGLGCRFMLNRFGRHLGALNWLTRLPVDYLKLDSGMARELRRPVVLQSIATIVELCRLLGIGTIASGADTTDIVERFQALDVQYAEGAVFEVSAGKPTPPADA